MESLIFHGDAFSEYYLTHLLWDEPRLKALLGLDTIQASYRRAAAEILRAQRALRARQQSRSTRTILLNPIAEILGWTLGEASTVATAEGEEDAGQPLLIEGKTIARVITIGPDAPLDLPVTGTHRRFAPNFSIIRVLEEQNLMWGVLLNAYELRLVRRAEGFVSSYIGFDLTSIAEGSQPGFRAWQLLWALLRADALSTDPPVLERVVEEGRQHQEGVGESLGEQIEGAVVAFVQGILSHPMNAQHHHELINPEGLKQLYTESLRILYRILFVLYGESRNLLPLDMPAYDGGYALTRLARRAAAPETDPRLNPTPSGRYFEWSIRALFNLLREGASLGPEGCIPKYDGTLFDPSRTTLVESLAWGDQAVASVLEKLTLIPARNRGLVRLSYRELDVEQLGAIYENLLEQIPQVAHEILYRVALEKRQLIVNAAERARLAQRRGETLETPSSTEEEDEDTLPEDDAESEEITEEADDEARARGPKKPIRVLEEIPQGSVFLKAGMGRKQTGSFYTSRPLVEFLVRQTVDPLATSKSPEEILSLRILDTAMGSGHFLVGACRRMSEHLLSAYRERYEKVVAEHSELAPGDVFLEAGIHPTVAANWEHEDRALTACRLLIAGNCLYGVDKNPLAVDLARVSLWLATAATDHPLTFLDHRLRVGDSLIGLPLWLGGAEEPEVHLLKLDLPSSKKRKRKKEYTGIPLLNGIRVQEILTGTTRQLRERIRRVMRHLNTIGEIENVNPGDFVGQRTAFDAMQGELQPFRELHSLRIGRQFTPATTMEEADIVNRWLSDISESGRASERSRTIAALALSRGEELGAFCWQLAFPEVFFDFEGQPLHAAGFDVIIGNPPWDKIKPNERECFSDFDPTVWDVQGQERKRLISRLCAENPEAKAAWEKHESETKTIAAFLLEGGLYHHQIAIVEDKKTGGDPDTFKFFLERAWQLLREGGRAGIIMPLGIQGSLGTTGLRRLLLDHCQLAVLCKLDNERYIFPGVFHGQKFDLVAFSKGGRTENFEAAFYSWEPADVLLRFKNDPRHLTVDAALYRELSPEQYTFVELHDQGEIELLRRIYNQFPRLGEKSDDTWNISYTRELDMTNDSYLFRDATRLKTMGATLHSRLRPVTETAQDAPFEENEGGEYWTTLEDTWYASQPTRFVRIERWVNSKGQIHFPNEIEEDLIAYRLRGYVPIEEADERNALPVIPGETYVPLYEGRMVHQFDHCQKAYVSGSGRGAKWQTLDWPDKRIIPHYFVAVSDFKALCPSQQKYRAGFCDVTGQGNERSALSCIIPAGIPAGNSVPTAISDQGPFAAMLFSALLNSYVLDFLLRKTISNHLNFFILNSRAVPRPLLSDQKSREIIHRSIRLSSTSYEMTALWMLVYEGNLSLDSTLWSRDLACLDPRQRAVLRAEIDALVAQIYGLTGYEYARILATFPLLDQDQPPLPGDAFIRMTNKGEKIVPRGFITRDLALLTFFELIGQAPPHDIVVFFADAGVNIERQTGPIRDLSERVAEATRRGAVAYIPSTGSGWNPKESPYVPKDLPEVLIRDWAGNLASYVIEDPQINGGEPSLKGTRITTSLISDLLNKGWTFKQVLDSYPHLTFQQVAIALRWGQLQ